MRLESVGILPQTSVGEFVTLDIKLVIWSVDKSLQRTKSINCSFSVGPKLQKFDGSARAELKKIFHIIFNLSKEFSKFT